MSPKSEPSVRQRAERKAREFVAAGILAGKARREAARPLANRRSLDAIAAEVHAIDRGSVFAVGDLLIEAKESCEHGEWLPWLADFSWSADTAERYMNVAKLGTKYRRLRNLKLPKMTLYSLLDEDEATLPAILDALAKRAKKVWIKHDDAEEVIQLVRLKHRFGDLPQATLDKLEFLESCGSAWSADAMEELKHKRPNTAWAATEIVDNVQVAHVKKLYAPHGTLPDVPSECLDDLEGVADDDRERVMKAILDVGRPLSSDDVLNICFRADEDTSIVPEDDADADAGAADEDAEASAPDELVDALRTVLKYADDPRPLIVRGVSPVALAQISQFVADMGKAANGGSKAKTVADRAEARSMRQRSLT